MSNEVLNIINKFDSVLIVGPYPPPLGGVSVYIQRLILLTKKPKVIDTSINGWHKFFKLFWVLMFGRQKIIHVHVLTIKILSIIYFIKIFKSFEVMLTDHNSRIFEDRSKIEVTMLKYFLNKCEYLVVVGAHIKKNYADAGLKRKLREAIETQRPNKSGINRLLNNHKNGFKKRREVHNKPCTEINFR